ncbi:homoserine/homoserine lactone efflux protein [Spartinivicinus ruber]|uniref:homoserine/homoserine lactone efflux protein n=1 Tax=Spartinivicinus ruber TaxID=2683272 RepID=UPI0013D8B230|nr:homoserine/homoserine lactone efflux protein [Spartinivicinus ruber]
MAIEVWLAYFVATVILSISPGAGAVNTISNAMNHGFKVSLISNLGLQFGNVIVITLVGVGLGAVLAQSETLFLWIKWFGVLYLIYLGIQKFREVSTQKQTTSNSSCIPKNYWVLFFQSLLVNVTNPKSIVFLVALFPQFIDPDLPQGIQVFILGSTSVLVDLVVMIGYGLLAARLAQYVHSERHMKIQNRVFGSMFIGAGSLLALAGQK